MNAEIILNMVKPYIRNESLSYEEFQKIFAILSKNEQDAAAEILQESGINLTSEKGDPPILLDIEEYLCDESDESFDVLYNASLFEDKRVADLIVRKKITQSNEALCKLIQQGNRQAMQDLCVKNNGLINRYVWAYRKYYGHRCDWEDLAQVGFIGLLKAAQLYDPLAGASFTTYAIYWIKQSISREIIDNGFDLRIPAYMMERINKVSRVDFQFAKEGYSPSERIPLIADELGFSQSAVRECLVLRNNYLTHLSLDSPVGEEEDSVLGDLIPNDKDPSVEQIVFDKELRKELETIMLLLTPREEMVLKSRLGWDDGRIYTLEEVGRIFGLTRERIRQIEFKAIKRLARRRETLHLKVFWEAD